MNQLRVMTFNLRVATAADGDNQWEMRKEYVHQVIRENDPDILATQEARQQQAAFLAGKLAEYIHIGVGRDGEAGEQNAVFLRKERFEIQESGAFWLSETPESVGSMGWDAAYSRLATWIRAIDRNARRPILILNTHLDNKGEVARLEGARQVHRWLAHHAHTEGAILCGDFNCSDESPPLKALLVTMPNLQLIDSYRSAHPQKEKDEATLHHYKGGLEGSRIDFILHTPHFRVNESDIVRTSKNGRYPSDHYPVRATIEWVGHP